MLDGELIDSKLLPHLPWDTLKNYITFRNDNNDTYTLITDLGLTYRYRYHFGLNLEVVVKSVDISVIIDRLVEQWRLLGNILSQQTQNICITFVQCWASVEDVGPTVYKC